ncbi:MAG: CBS domain-containing protein [Saprospiraceae bacterium]|jgi:CBS domain-containing protein
MKNFQQKSLDEDLKDRKLKAPSVTAYMVSKLITFTPETKITSVINTLLENRITGGAVLNDKNKIVGLIDDKDCLNVLIASAYYNHPVGNDTVASYMTKDMRTITIHNDIIDVSNIFLKERYKRLLVVDDDGKLVGQISRRDILRAIKDLNTNTW